MGVRHDVHDLLRAIPSRDRATLLIRPDGLQQPTQRVFVRHHGFLQHLMQQGDAALHGHLAIGSRDVVPCLQDGIVADGVGTHVVRGLHAVQHVVARLRGRKRAVHVGAVVFAMASRADLVPALEDASECEGIGAHAVISHHSIEDAHRLVRRLRSFGVG
eukprot:CAMPEP_0198113726 /NCGR_PEP_ID=MMETSP1442-20131203/5327_1 /TAXON_ID= /ORGANISM="Craspedostauros australis, Strain CCMP3328" /LENGTH=159 /DNA_ID=CAMNT_0043770897 /DNA_START=678 /DNA_END=1154 /DNA_ORIENTATION=-